MTSKFALNIYGANLCDEAMEFERMEKEIVALKAKLSSKKPICPICQSEMKSINYQGYYDQFSFWECGCEKFEKADYEQSGQYAWNQNTNSWNLKMVGELDLWYLSEG